MKAQPKQACTEVDNLVNKYLIEVSEKIERLLLLKETLIDLKQHCSTDRTVDECGILKNCKITFNSIYKPIKSITHVMLF